MSPWAVRSLVPAYWPGWGWDRSTSAEDWACSSRRWWSSGSYWAAAWATRRSVMTGPQPMRSASWSSTQRAPAWGRRRVCWATRRACQAGIWRRRTRFHSFGWRWVRSRVSAIRFRAEPGETPIAVARDSGAKAATAGVPGPPSVSSASRTPRPGPSGVSTPVSAVAGWRTAHWWASSRRRSSIRRDSTSTRAARASTAAGSRSPTSYRSSGAVLMRRSKHRPPTVVGARSPCPQGF